MKPLVLIVDDSFVIRAQVRRALSEAGMDVAEAVDGEDALRQLDATTPALVVCDVNMPRMNGIEFLERKAELRNGTPVLILTTEGQPEFIQRARSLGAKAWMVKPFNGPMLVAAARRLLGRAA